MTRNDGIAPREQSEGPVIVLGVERSGTSLVTEMVHRWGAYAGEPGTLYGGDERNPQGFWEYRPLWEFMGELCRAAGLSWWDAAYKRPAEDNGFLHEQETKAREIVAGMHHQGRPWVWKYPDLTFFMPFWKKAWGDARYVVTVRNPHDSALSWQKFVTWQGQRPSLNLVAGDLLRWHLRMQSILEQTEGAERLFIGYERLVQSPYAEAKRLRDFLNRKGARPGCDGTVESMAQAVNPKLWRNRSEASFDDVEEATRAQKALYRFLQTRAQDVEVSPEREEWSLYPGALDLAKNQELFTEYFNLSNRLLTFYPVQLVLALLRPLGYLVYASEIERYVPERADHRSHLKRLARICSVAMRLHCSLRRVYRKAIRGAKPDWSRLFQRAPGQAKSDASQVAATARVPGHRGKDATARSVSPPATGP
jgi:hypothetical protein